MDSRAGSILLLISGILTFVFAGVIFLIMVIALVIAEGVVEVLVVTLLMVLVFVIVIVMGILKLYASKWMKDPLRTKKGGILALVVGILSGDVLAIVGGILGMVQGSPLY